MIPTTSRASLSHILSPKDILGPQERQTDNHTVMSQWHHDGSSRHGFSLNLLHAACCCAMCRGRRGARKRHTPSQLRACSGACGGS